MARIRTIKPDFWKHEELSELPAETHMLAAALLNHADDEGYFKANPKLVEAECFPLRESSMSAHDMLMQLAEIGYISLMEGSDGKRYGHITKFEKHQTISRKTPSKIKELCTLHESSMSPPEQLHSGKERGTGNREYTSPNGDGASAPLDLKAAIFGPGLDWLANKSGRQKGKIQSMAGRWCSKHGDNATLLAIHEAKRCEALDPIPYIEQTLKGGKHEPSGGLTEALLASIAGELDDTARHPAGGDGGEPGPGDSEPGGGEVGPESLRGGDETAGGLRGSVRDQAGERGGGVQVLPGGLGEHSAGPVDAGGEADHGGVEVQPTPETSGHTGAHCPGAGGASQAIDATAECEVVDWSAG